MRGYIHSFVNFLLIYSSFFLIKKNLVVEILLNIPIKTSWFMEIAITNMPLWKTSWLNGNENLNFLGFVDCIMDESFKGIMVLYLPPFVHG